MRLLGAAAVLLYTAFNSPHAHARTVILGDSMMASEHGGGSQIKRWLETYAGHAIENYAVVGSSMHKGWVASVPEEYAKLSLAKKDPPTTIIMDGGGNDVMTDMRNCQDFNDHCRHTIDEAATMAAELMNQAHADGTAHVLHMGFFYGRGLNNVIDYGTEKMKAACESAPLDCHFADLRDLKVPTIWDGLHPTNDGYKIVAHRLWEVKLENEIPI